MNNLMEYRGYHAKPEYSDDDGCFVGRVLGINDMIAFDGNSVEEFRAAFHESVDGYLEMCTQHGKTPNKEYSGQFNLRLPPEIHRRLALAAEQGGGSLNTVVVDAVTRYLSTTLPTMP